MVVKHLKFNKKTYLYNDLINIKNFDPNLLRLRKNESPNCDILSIGYITVKSAHGYEDINNVNPLYLMITYVNAYIEENNGQKSLNFMLTDDNSDFLSNMAGCSFEYGKDNMTIKFDYDDILPFNKTLKFHVLKIIIRHIFKKGDVYYPQILLDDSL